MQKMLSMKSSGTKSLLFLCLSMLFITSLFSFSTTTEAAYVETIPGGYIQRDIHIVIKGKDLASKRQINTVYSQARSNIIKKYGKVETKKSYNVYYDNEVKQSGWGYSHKGRVINVRAYRK